MSAPTADEILTWPVTVPVPQAGACWLMGRDLSYQLARSGQFPVPVIRVGRRLVVTRASILAALGIDARAIGDPQKPRKLNNIEEAGAVAWLSSLPRSTSATLDSRAPGEQVERYHYGSATDGGAPT
jgi:hypothetical protein